MDLRSAIPTIPDREQLLNEVKTAELTGKAVSTLRNDRFKRRNLPYVKMGRSVRYKLGDILDYIAAHRIEPDEAA